MEVANPDLDFINLYETVDNKLIRKTETGELRNVYTREIYHRNFLFIINLKKDSVYTYYISANNGGHSFFIPLKLVERTAFEKTDNKVELIYWLIFGILLFVIMFNIYLYQITSDKVNLFYFLYVIFATLTLFSYDGYLYFFNPPVFVEKIKWIMPALYLLFMLSFTQAFTSYNLRLSKLNMYINPFKFIAFIAVFFYHFKYPWSLIADIGIPILILGSLILIMVISAIAIRKGYSPSKFLFMAYSTIFVGFLLNELKEFNLISSSFFVENSSKFGQTVECLLLTVAVLERFRINQKNDKQTIQENLVKIERQNKELEIINTELEKLSIVASETDNSIAIYNSNGILEWCNSGFEKLYEVEINDLIKNGNDRIEKIIPNKNISGYVKYCLKSKSPVVFETLVRNMNMKELWIQTTLSPFIRSEEISMIISIDSDITSLKKYQKEIEIARDKAEESDRLKTAFLHNISHEIRTPMNAIIGFSGFLNDPETDDEKRQQFTEIIVQSTNQLLSIITDIISIASIEAGQEKVIERPVELNKTMRYLHEQFLIKASKKDLKLSLSLPSPRHELTIMADETKLIQVLTNLIENALKFTKKGHVRFGHVTTDREIEFFVEDTGIGIDPAMHKEIFERFRQVDSSLSRKYGGSGLGLSISKAYVELMGGRIWVKSTLDKGSTFYFTIPFKTTEPISKPKRKTSLVLKSNVLDEPFTVLIAEDEDSNFRLLKESLSGQNVEIIWVVNGIQAVKACRSRHIDLVLMDMKMPEMNGYEATRQIRQFSPHLPVIAQTAYYTESDIEKALDCGCNDVISKPLNRDKLITIINEQLLNHAPDSNRSHR
jgi:signal transduction histidine kinase/ActR/RegA family two-component response regulator